MPADFDPVAEAAQVAVAAEAAAAQRRRSLTFSDLYKARRALHVSALLDEPDAYGWAARITGASALYRLERLFLARTCHVLDGDAPAALDFSPVRSGDVLQVRCESHSNRRRRQSGHDAFFRVIAIDDYGVIIAPLDTGEVAALYHGSLR